MSAILSDAEKNRVRHHTGYLLTSPAASIQLGVPRASQAMFLVEQAMNLIMDDAVGIIRAHISRLDRIEEQMDEARERLVAKEVGDIVLRDDEPDLLEKEYRRWAVRLADDLGIPLNAYSERFRSGGISLNARVQN
jgi:hypothetical protein